MSQKQSPSLQLTAVLKKRIVWFTIGMCLILLLTTIIVGVQKSPTGAHAAQVVHAPTHVPAKSHAHQPPHAPRTMPTMSVSPLALSFTQSLASPNILTQTFVIKNSGVRSLYWHVSTNPLVAAWVSSSIPTKGTLASMQTVSVTVTVKPTQLAVGTYATSLVLIGVDQQGLVAVGSPQTVAITLTVTK